MANWKNIIAEIREQTGWTLYEISEETGIAQGYLSQLQTGKRREDIRPRLDAQTMSLFKQVNSNVGWLEDSSIRHKVDR